MRLRWVCILAASLGVPSFAYAGEQSGVMRRVSCSVVRFYVARYSAPAAEQWALENGYTDLPAAEDSTRWVLEHGELGSWPGVLAARGGMLEREARSVQCSMRQCLVFFRVRRVPQLCAYRQVSMTQVFTRIRLEPGGIRDERCDERQV